MNSEKDNKPEQESNQEHDNKPEQENPENVTSHLPVNESGVVITNSSGIDASGNQFTQTILTTLDPSSNLQITENLTQVITTYADESPDLNGELVNQIREYASQISCSNFHGNGTISDYTELFNAASQIANESKQMDLQIDVEGFNEFADAADQLSNLFNGFILKLQNVNIINDKLFLNSILQALKKIVNLSNTFGKFKETIIATSVIQIPQSCHDANLILSGVMNEINCAVECINYFVNPTEEVPSGALLNETERHMIDTAVSTINQWNILCEQGVTIAMNNNSDVKNISQINNALKNKTTSLTNAISILNVKFNSMKLQ